MLIKTPMRRKLFGSSREDAGHGKRSAQNSRIIYTFKSFGELDPVSVAVLYTLLHAGRDGEVTCIHNQNKFGRRITHMDIGTRHVGRKHAQQNFASKITPLRDSYESNRIYSERCNELPFHDLCYYFRPVV